MKRKFKIIVRTEKGGLCLVSFMVSNVINIVFSSKEVKYFTIDDVLLITKVLQVNDIWYIILDEEGNEFSSFQLLSSVICLGVRADFLE